MKIFFLPTSYPDKDNPQRDIFIYEQAKELANRGHEIIVLHVKKLPSKNIYKIVNSKISHCDDGFAKRLVIQQKTFMETRLSLFNRRNFVKSVFKLYSYAVSIYGNPDVIYAHFSIWAGYAGSLISEKYHVPLVTIEHFSEFMKNEMCKGYKEALRFTIDSSEFFLCVSDGLKQSIIKHVHPEKELFVVPDMVDRNFIFKPLVDDKVFRICAIGNLNKRKDFETLIKAFIKAFPKEADVELHIGGDGPEKEYLERIVLEKKRQSQIKFLGKLSRNQTIKVYENCHMFALASKFETFGLVYREALAIGRPIVSTDHGGFSKNDWHNEYGYIVSVKDVDAFADAMRKIYNDYDKYDLKKISSLCLSDCSAESVGNKIEYFLSSASVNAK